MKNKKQILQKINKELKAGQYGAYGAENEFLSYDFYRFRSYCSGTILIGLGDGKFNDVVGSVIQLSQAWTEYQNKRWALFKKYKVDEFD